MNVSENPANAAELEKKNLMKLTCVVEIQFYGWFS